MGGHFFLIFNFHFHFHWSGGPVEKRGGGGEEEKLKPGGALQDHRAGDNDMVIYYES